MITWSTEALKRSDLTLDEADNLVALSSAAAENEAVAGFLANLPKPLPTTRAFPASVHIQRYAKQAKALGY